MACARRFASGTPRRRMPTSARSSTLGCRSRISWAMRASEREMRWASRTIGIGNLFASSQGRVKENAAEYISTRPRSVLQHAQAGHARKILDVARDERRRVEQRGGRDEKVHGGDGAAAAVRRREQAGVLGREPIVGVGDE